jgi:hypothetical protein
MKIETVSYQIDWSKFHKGYSFFVPCIDHRAAKKSVLAVAERLKMDVAVKVVIVDGVKGLRVWRV